MQLLAISLLATVTTPSPRVAPALVPATHIVKVPASLTSTDAPPAFIYLALEAGGAASATIEVWARDEAAVQPAQFAPSASDRWYQITQGATTTIAVAAIGLLDTDLKLPIFQGSVYLRVTTAPAIAARLLVGFGPSIGTA